MLLLPFQMTYIFHTAFSFWHFLESLLTTATFNTSVLLYGALHFNDQLSPLLSTCILLKRVQGTFGPSFKCNMEKP